MQIRTLLIIFTLLAFMSCGSFTAPKPTSTTENISEIDFSKDYTIQSLEYGSIAIVEIQEGNRIITSNAVPNHTTGTFPNPGNPNTISPQNINYKIPVTPKWSGEPKWAREPGVALNGIKFQPETAERFVCETGEVYRIEAVQEPVAMGLDFNNAHVQPTGAYHYHGVPTELVKILDTGKDLVQVGYAHDGFPIHYSKSGIYKPSYQLAKDLRTGDACNYRNPSQKMTKKFQDTQPDGTFVSDWEYVDGLGQLDECNGIEVNGQYTYFVTDEYPYVSRCLKGEFSEKGPKGPPPSGSHKHGDGGDHKH